jgi:hypothetical protein
VIHRLFALLTVLFLSTFGAASTFDFIDNSVSITAVSQTVTVGTANRPMSAVTIVNDGANEVFARFFRTGETIVPAVATDSGGYHIANGGVFTRTSLRTEGSPGYVAVSIVCSAAETATVKVWASAR